MPNSRRRRFSVQKNINQQIASKVTQNDSQNNCPAQNCNPVVENHEEFKKLMGQISGKSKKSKRKSIPIEFNNQTLQLAPESSQKICNTLESNKKNLINSKTDQESTASFSEINIFNILNSVYEPSHKDTESEFTTNNSTFEEKIEQQLQDTARRDRYPRQHRVKVRSPKRRAILLDENLISDTNKGTVGTNVFHQELQVQVEIQVQCDGQETTLSKQEQSETEITIPELIRPSNHSLDDMCRICHGGESSSLDMGQLISACTCRGTVGRVHVKCLERWLTESGKSRCELCGTKYATRRAHKYGVLRSLMMWLLSQNAKQLLVDSLGIMLMSPLAVLAAWLSGRTLAGLMKQDAHVAPWPLASTFVLACMTLVCYYCWIVSAATRHALAWWIWYRSQYEVRLQLHHDNEE